MRRLCLTVDLDRDVNVPVRGSVAAGSKDRGEGTAPRFDSTGKGTELLTELFDSIGIRATFFAEARALHRSGAFRSLSGHEVALHGLDHEDFSGEKTGLHLDHGDMREIVERSISLIRDCVGYQPKGFRSPYMTPNEDMLYFLGEYGIRYDSSYYAYLQGTMHPYRTESGLIEVPVPKATDAKGEPITSYLWPMHEGTRGPEDFIRMAEGMDDGLFVLATHSWHMCETEKGVLDPEDVRKNLDNVRTVIEGILDLGFDADTVASTVL